MGRLEKIEGVEIEELKQKRELLADSFNQVDLDEDLNKETLSAKRLEELKVKKKSLVF